jgi:energy-coupling factor transporter ATP-binding protein EcfA2
VLLLAGQSGAGKTTLALALARAGLGFLGDDTVFLVDRESSLHVLGFPDEVDVTDHTASLLPELSRLLDRPKPPGAVKHRLRAEEVYRTELVGSGPAGALVFPRISGAKDSELAPLSPDEALMELLPNVLLTDGASSQAHLDTLGRLAFDTPCYRLTAGTDLDRAAAVVASVAAAPDGWRSDHRRADAATMRRFSTGGGT